MKDQEKLEFEIMKEINGIKNFPNNDDYVYDILGCVARRTERKPSIS